MKNNELGCRGYVGSRIYQCGDFPQAVQNMVIRNYCQKHQLTYLLSATEYAMPGCYMILERNAVHSGACKEPGLFRVATFFCIFVPNCIT